MRVSLAWCSSKLPWDRFSRATFMPACSMAASVSGASEAGPMVATILVRRVPGRLGMDVCSRIGVGLSGSDA
jgi:hypothetical protein